MQTQTLSDTNARLGEQPSCGAYPPEGIVKSVPLVKCQECGHMYTHSLHSWEIANIWSHALVTSEAKPPSSLGSAGKVCRAVADTGSYTEHFLGMVAKGGTLNSEL